MECNIKTIFYVLLFTIPAGAVNDYTFKPSKYDLKIVTTANNFKDNAEGEDLKFSGNVIIDLDIKRVNEKAGEVKIVLNSNSNFKEKDCKVKGFKGGKWQDISGTKCVAKDDKLNITIPSYDPTFINYQLDITFTNGLRNDMTGFYRSSYVDSSNKTRWLLTTHFEPVYARRAFPCFDQPDLKAKFSIQITAPKDKKTVLCNTPTDGGLAEGDNLKFTCKETSEMSTYLVAFTVSDFSATEEVKFSSEFPASLPKDRKLKTYGRDEIIKGKCADLAQQVGKAAITELGKYLNLGYAFEKVDQIGIPDFSAGAMENWGHISFREKSLFFNKTSGTTLTKQANVLTITHELVHQWFGNLVTLESWDYIWLNEAFANYLEYVIASKFELDDVKGAEWELLKQIVVSEMHSRAFETDGLSSSKPLNNKITDESLILPSFNDIPYAKGASVLRMWEGALGSDKFQKVLQKYISERKYQTANPKVLYDFFKSEANMNEEFFKTWTEQAGYPVVEVKKVKDNKYNITQRRFLWENVNSTSTWYVPISYANSTDKWDVAPKVWLHKDPISVEIVGKWFVVNNQQSGYYRVNYDQENWNALSEALSANMSAINEINRAQIINDVYSLARSLQSDYVPYSTALTLTKYLHKEKSFYPWKTALNAFEFVQTKLRGAEVYDKFNEYVLSLVKPNFEKLDFKDGKHIDKLRNIEISRWACSLGLKDCVQQAEKMFNDSTYPSYPDVQEIVLCTVVKHRNVWDDIFKKYSAEKDSSLKLLYISALGCTNNQTEAEGFLNKTLEKNSNIRTQDRGFVLSAVYNGNGKLVETAFNFIEKKYAEIAKEYGGINPLGKALVGIARKLNTQKDLQRLESLVKKIKEGEEGKAAKDSLENALNIAKSNVEWVKLRQNQFHKYFNAGSFVTYSLALLSLCLAAVFNSK